MSQELFHTMNIKVAAALVTLGFEMSSPPVTRIVREDGVESVLFWFQSTDAKGNKAIIASHGMTKGGNELSEADPENPLNYMRVFAANRDSMIGLIKNTPRQIHVSKNGTNLVLPENASENNKRQSAAMI